jgi:hypothetical protein
MRERILAAALVALTAAVGAAEYELKWDTGRPACHGECLNVGAGFWFANDFDVSTLKARHIAALKIMVYPYGGMWDGFRIGLFAFDKIPGSIIWPTSGVPKFVKGSGPGEFQWCKFAVDWTLPAETQSFAAGQEQFFLPPFCDQYVFDDNVEHKWHTWQKSPHREWNLYYSSELGKNLMLRVILTGDEAVRPTSLGRVKGLYY